MPTPAGVAALVREEAGGLLGDDDVLLAVRDARSTSSPAPARWSRCCACPGVTDVLVNGPDQVWVDRGAGLERTAVRFPDDDAVRRLAVRLAAAAGRRLDDAAPWVDVGPARRHPAARRAAAGVRAAARACRCGCCAAASLDLADLDGAGGTLPGESGRLLAGGRARGGWPSWSPAAPARARRRCSPRCSAWSARPSGSCSARTPPSSRRRTRTSSGC